MGVEKWPSRLGPSSSRLNGRACSGHGEPASGEPAQPLCDVKHVEEDIMGVRSSLFLLGLVLSIGVAPSCNIDTCEGGNCSEGKKSGESRNRECATAREAEPLRGAAKREFRRLRERLPTTLSGRRANGRALRVRRAQRLPQSDRRALSGGSRGRRRQRGEHRGMAHRRQRRFRRRRGWQCWRQRWFEWDRRLREWRSLRRREWQLRCGTADGLHA